MTEDWEPVPEDMGVHVRYAYERITRGVLTTRDERVAIYAALEQLRIDLERDLY